MSHSISSYLGMGTPWSLNNFLHDGDVAGVQWGLIHNRGLVSWCPSPGVDEEGGGDDGEDCPAHGAGHHGRAARAVRVARLGPQALALGGGRGRLVEGAAGLDVKMLTTVLDINSLLCL